MARMKDEQRLQMITRQRAAELADVSLDRGEVDPARRPPGLPTRT